MPDFRLKYAGQSNLKKKGIGYFVLFNVWVGALAWLSY